jgi:hypothetical protein
MPCFTTFRRNQTMTVRKSEVKKVMDTVAQGLARGRIKAKVGPKGGIAFVGLTDEERDDVTDACIYRMIMRGGSALTRHMITKAEQLAGRGVDRAVVNGGHHSHDGGETWHEGH